MALASDDSTDFEKYMYRNKISLMRRDVQNIMSVPAVEKETTLAVQSCPLFKNYSTLEEFKKNLNANMFQVSENVDFVTVSGMVDGDTHVLRVNSAWDGLKTWLNDDEELSDKNVLRAFIRT